MSAPERHLHALERPANPPRDPQGRISITLALLPSELSILHNALYDQAEYFSAAAKITGCSREGSEVFAHRARTLSMLDDLICILAFCADHPDAAEIT